jgi:ribA/ribD-fused uncharacterized protein
VGLTLEEEWIKEGPLGPGVDAELERKRQSPTTFWGGPFSNFAVCRVQLINPWTDTHTEYLTVEHYFQALKATNAKDHHYVHQAPTAKAAKQRGREIKLRSDWGQVRLLVMLDGLRAKFAKEPFNKLLLDTGDRYLAEDSPYDDQWGIRARDGSWSGYNLLGRALMQVREEIK